MKRFLFLCDLLLFLLFCLSGCGNTGDTDEIHLYVREGNPLLTKTIELYKEQYPQVEVVVEDINYEAYEEKLVTDLMSGGGPDVIYFSSGTFPDIYKTMDAGVLLDLGPYMNEDEEFDRADYVEAVVSAGIYRGRQYLIPTQYTTTTLLSEKTILEKEGIANLQEMVDYSEFWKTLLSAVQRLRGNPQFDTVIGNFSGRHLRYNAGVPLVDRETGEIFPEPEALRTLTEAYKRVMFDNQALGREAPIYFQEDAAKGLRNLECVLIADANTSWNSYFQQTCGYAKTLGETVSFPLPTVGGGACAQVLNSIGINAKTQNVDNAWNFIKIFLSSEVQTAYGAGGLSANKEMQEKVLESYRKQMGLGDAVTKQTGTPVTFSEEEVGEHLAQVQNITSAAYPEQTLWDYYEKYITPYCRGEKSYEECLADLKEQLNIYLRE